MTNMLNVAALIILSSFASLLNMSEDCRNRFFHDLDSTTFILIDKQELSLSLIDSTGHIAKTYPIACAMYYGNKERKGDHKTPEGQFPINQIINSSNLTHNFGDGLGRIAGAYGPWFIRLDVPGVVDIGIHGTHLPESIGSRSTEGCIRMRNDDIEDLKNRVYLGMPVVILPDSMGTPSFGNQEITADREYDYFVSSSLEDRHASDSLCLLLADNGLRYYQHFKSGLLLEQPDLLALMHSKNLLLFGENTDISNVITASIALTDTSITCLYYPSDKELLPPLLHSPTETHVLSPKIGLTLLLILLLAATSAIIIFKNTHRRLLDFQIFV